MELGVNKVLLVGHLGSDPEKRYTPSGKIWVKMSVATHYRKKGEENQKQSDTEWHRVVAWGNLAESCCQFLKKGNSVLVDGRLQSSRWQDAEGKVRTKTEVNAVRVLFLDPASS